MPSSRIQHRIEANLKSEAETILLAQGIRPSQAITIFYTEIKRTGGFPFLPSPIPNKKLAKDLQEANKGVGVKTYKTKKDLFDSINRKVAGQPKNLSFQILTT